MCVTYVSCTCTWVVLFDLFISHVQSYWQGWGTHVVHNRSHLVSILKLGFMKGILCILPILYWNRWSPLARLGIRYSLWGGLLPTKPHRRSILVCDDCKNMKAATILIFCFSMIAIYHRKSKWHQNRTSRYLPGGCPMASVAKLTSHPVKGHTS